MCWLDDRLVEAIEKAGLRLISGARYMDDIRIWCHAVRLGWRMEGDTLIFKSSWRKEEMGNGMTPLQKTTQILKAMMNNVCGWLVLTMETEDMFESGLLPTLDLEIGVLMDNKIIYQYYEKPMVPNMVLHRRSAMPENTRRSTLNQELIRRMINTSELVAMDKRIEIVDKYAQKLINSEYSVDQTRKAVIGGLKGYERLLSLSRDTGNPKWKPLHLAAGWNSRNRRTAKQRNKTNWYKGKPEVEHPENPRREEEATRFSIHKGEPSIPEEDKISQEEGMQSGQNKEELPGGSRQDTTPAVPGGTGSRQSRNKKKRGPDRGTVTLGGLNKIRKAKRRKARSNLRKKLGKHNVQVRQLTDRKAGPLPPTRSVFFVDNTAGGMLAKRFQQAEETTGDMTGYRIRITESAGTPMSMLLPSTNPWGPQDCLREDCVTCRQGDERRIDCRKRNILYESECTICKKTKDEGDRERIKSGRGVYVGESSRSIYERSKEHVAGRVIQDEDNHQIKHWLSSHEDLLAPPEFKFTIIKTFQDPLTRQLSEAVRIERRGEEILNSKSEFSRCRVPRLRVDLEGWKEKKKTLEQEAGITSSRTSSQLVEPSIQEVEEKRLQEEAELSLSERDIKRKTGMQEGSKSKRRKLAKVAGWGLQTCQEEDPDQQEEPWVLRREDWTAKTGALEESTSLKQSCVSGWLEGSIPPPLGPTGWIENQSMKMKKNERKTGKLTKAEVKRMKGMHKDIGSLLGGKLEKEDHPGREQEQEELKEVPELEKEERLSRWRMKKRSWEARKFCKAVLEDIISSMELDQSPVCMTRSGWKSSQDGITDGAAGSVEGTGNNNEYETFTLRGEGSRLDTTPPGVVVREALDGDDKLEPDKISTPTPYREQRNITVTLLGEGSRLDTTPPGVVVKKALDGGDKLELEDISTSAPRIGYINVMTVMHTPLLGPNCVTQHLRSGQAGQISDSMKPGAGFNTLDMGLPNQTDIRKPLRSHTSPNLEIPTQVTLDKSPTMIGGRMERFGEIAGMIAHWEGQEGGTEKEGKEGGRRKSKVVEELSLKFEGPDMKNRSLSSSLEKGEGGTCNMKRGIFV